jgi:hypothetical protein
MGDELTDLGPEQARDALRQIGSVTTRVRAEADRIPGYLAFLFWVPAALIVAAPFAVGAVRERGA